MQKVGVDIAGLYHRTHGCPLLFESSRVYVRYSCLGDFTIKLNRVGGCQLNIPDRPFLPPSLYPACVFGAHWGQAYTLPGTRIVFYDNELSLLM